MPELLQVSTDINLLWGVEDISKFRVIWGAVVKWFSETGIGSSLSVIIEFFLAAGLGWGIIVKDIFWIFI